MTTELVKMSPKGQLVVPQEIRAEKRLKPGDRFIALALEEGILFKRVVIPELKAEFKALSKEIETQFRRQKVAQKDVSEAVGWARKRSSSTRTS